MERTVNEYEKRILVFLSTKRLLISKEVISNYLDLRLSLVETCLNRLLEEKMIEVDYLPQEATGATYYVLSDKGIICLKELENERKDKVIWSVLVPLTISVLGSLLTNFLLFK